MKKRFILLLIFISIILTGCVSVQEMSLEEVINTGTDRKISVYNKYRKGYKYNLPKGLDVVDSTEYNEIIMSKNYKYYLYVDAVSYYNKVIETYEISDESYVSRQISYEDKYGYLEINDLDKDKYFIEIMYNYAKIEVIVDANNINKVVAYAISILSSIEYNDNILDNLLGDNVLYFKDEDFNIFETAKTESNYLNYIEKYDNYETEEKKDNDFIN